MTKAVPVYPAPQLVALVVEEGQTTGGAEQPLLSTVTDFTQVGGVKVIF
ncbi:hypothetical protein [Undibacterium oligocarboniphilum]|uniref:Uncharacterized protein n=1 Tax=Undibacterium oligocarboniphilum TaxID=666702 RepID=A0A850QNL8_9BURK|nr:hypothetical protein [Undibacterium oligocarboniphilum]MBC3871451.1 hypothetical protein [Undibacterium oligocarboniphilum]NVO78973.1 hypothetical protein [Undibacterium oligocarboniphilum]